MKRELALKVVLVMVGVLFLAGAYPLVLFIRQEPAVSMMLSLYVTLGVFLLLAARDPSTHRSLISFTAWSSIAHAAVMAVQSAAHVILGDELVGVVLLAIIGAALLALAPARPQARASAAAA